MRETVLKKEPKRSANKYIQKPLNKGHYDKRHM